VGICRSYRKPSNDAWPANPRVHPETVEGLLEESVFAESGLSLKTPTAVGSGEQARRQGERVCQSEAGLVRGLGQELLPEELLGLPEVGRLPGEGGAMHQHQVREEVSVVAPEVRKELRVFVEPQELSDDLDGKDFRVAERWGGSASSEAPEVLESVVCEAKDGYDEGAKIQQKTTATSGAIGLTLSVGRSSSLLKSSKKLAHRVS
jgi:hypothetical protein